MISVPLDKRWLLIITLALGIGGGLGFRSLDHSVLSFPHETLTDIVPHPADSSKLLVASGRDLYLRDGKQNWKRLLCGSTDHGPIRQLVLPPGLKDKVFIRAEDGVLECDLKKEKEKFVFRGGLPPNRTSGLAFHSDEPNTIYLGTDRGLFLSGDGGKTWLRPFRWPENQHVEFVAFLPLNPPILLFGTSRELFFSKDGGATFESGFSLPFSREEESEETEEEDGKEKTRPVPRFTSFAFSSEHPSRLWVGTSEGVFESKDGGVEWERLPNTGLAIPQITDLAFSDRRGGLIAMTPHGVAKYLPSRRRWESLPIPLTSPPTSLVLQTKPGNNEEVLLVASGKEVLEWVLSPIETPAAQPSFVASPERMELFQRLLRLEPTIRQVQKATIHYGDLGNGKIKRWQWGSRVRSLIPKVSFGKDFSFSSNVDIDRGGTNNPDFFIAGPDNRHKAMNLDLTWELGDLLYSSAQPSIDNRMKLLVELRESILSEVTRIYFERRRVQTELAFSPPQSPQEYYELLFHLDELTAQLDALTNGFLSRQLQKIQEIYPELRDLWNYD